MPTVQCDIEGLEEVNITFPDRWLIGHSRLFWEHYNYDPDPTKVLHNHGLLLGCCAVCDKVEGLPDNPEEWPVEILFWIIDTVYNNSFAKASNPSKN